MSEDNNLVDRVVRAVDQQTTPMQPDRVPASKVVMSREAHGNQNAGRVRRALDEAVKAGRLERDEEDVWIPE